jgi:hypothetical protein
LVSAPAIFPMTPCTSAIAASSPDIMITGTLKCPAIAAFHAPSVIVTPFSATRVRLALEKVWARTPFVLLVLAW